MFAPRSILVPTDYSRAAEQALFLALAIAWQHNARLDILHVKVQPRDAADAREGPTRNGSKTRQAERVQSMAERIRQLVSPGQAHPLRVRHAVRTAESAQYGILSFAAAHKPDFIALGTHGRAGADRLLIGSVAEAIVRFARSPVLTVGPRGGRMLHQVRRILVPIDFSESSATALTMAKKIASQNEAELILLHAMKPVSIFYGDHPEIVEQHGSSPVQHAHMRLDAFMKSTAGPSAPARYHVTTGDAAQRIVAFARSEEVHLIVHGTRGLAGSTYAEEGSTAVEVVRTAPCPVVTLRNAAWTAEDATG